MVHGLYVAASGMAAELARQDQISNDLANAATPGYKADRSTQRRFGEILLTNMATGERVGSTSLGVGINSTVTDFSQGPIRVTEQPLDMALEGDGFFVVQTPAGDRYTRSGQFQRSANGTLVNVDGFQVVGRDGRPIPVRDDGTVDPTSMRIVTLEGAVKAGGNMFNGTPNVMAEPRVRTGALESSGTNAAKAMVDLIASMRTFESTQRVITTIDSTLQKAANQVGTT